MMPKVRDPVNEGRNFAQNCQRNKKLKKGERLRGLIYLLSANKGKNQGRGKRD